MGTKKYNNALDLVSFSRASGGTALRKISYGPELVTNGTFDSDTDWTKGSTSNAVISGGSITVNSGDLTNDRFAYQVITTEVGKVYEFSYEIVSGTSGVVRVGGDIGSNSVFQRTSFVVGSYNKSLVADSTTTYISLAGPSGSDLTLDNVSVKEVLFDQPDGTLKLFNHPDDVPRIDYDTSGNPKGILIEEARTNLIIYSEDFDTGYPSKTGVTVSSGFGTSLDGGVNADKLVADTSNGFHRIAKTGIATSSGVDYSYSCFFKAAGETVAGLALFDGTNWLGRASIDLETGVASVSNGSAKVDDYGNGWYRLTVYGASVATSHTAYVYVKSLFTTTGNGVDGILAYGAQLEAGSFPTSYIPTSGASATRAADIASIDVDQFGYNQKAGSVVVEFDRLYTGTNGMYVAGISDGTTNNIIRVYGISSSNDGFYSSSDGVQGLLSQSTGAMTTEFKTMAGALKLNNAAVIDSFGGTLYEDSSFEMPLNVSVVSIGSNNGTTQLNGHIKSLKYYPRRLSNAQLQELTS